MTASIGVSGPPGLIAPRRSGARGPRSRSSQSASVAVIGDGRRERLAGDVALVRPRRVQQLRVAAEPSSIRSVTSRPACLRAFCTARTISRASPSRRSSSSSSRASATAWPASRLDQVALERLACTRRQVVGLERVLVAVDVDPDLAARRRSPRRPSAGVERLDRGGDLRHVLAEARAERAVVRLHA